MILKPDNRAHAAWALENIQTGEMVVTDILDTEHEALMLLENVARHQPHRGAHRVIQVSVRIEKVN